MKWLIAIVLGISLVGCSSDSDKTVETKKEPKSENYTDAVKELKAFEDSLKNVSASGSLEYSQETAVVYAEKCLAITHRFPKSKDAPKYMDKAHIIFASSNLHQRSVIIADSLIMMYPMYKNRPMVLESLAGSYDVFVIPRQKDKVKKYYEMLLKESPDMDPAQRKQIENRLKYVDLTFDEYVSKAN
jgi:hypothetical protein